MVSHPCLCFCKIMTKNFLRVQKSLKLLHIIVAQNPHHGVSHRKRINLTSLPSTAKHQPHLPSAEVNSKYFHNGFVSELLAKSQTSSSYQVSETLNYQEMPSSIQCDNC